MLRSLITNNCHGAVIYVEKRWEYASPTISTQILPRDFVKFCSKLKAYLEMPLEEYRDLSDEHERELIRFYGDELDAWPIGIIDDVMIIFRHETDFATAADKWNRRKERVDYNSLAYMLDAVNESYADDIQAFLDLKLPHSVVLTQGFSYPGCCRYDVPANNDPFGWTYGRKVIEDNFSIAEWLEL